MTAAQALTGLAGAPAGGVKDTRAGASDRAGRSEPSFDDTLEEAQRSQDARSQKGLDRAASADGPRGRPGPAEGSRRKGEAAKSDVDEDDGAEPDDTAAAASQGDSTDATSVALMLAALASSAAAGAGDQPGSRGEAQSGRPSNPTSATDALALPGAVETPDAEALLDLLTAGGAVDASEAEVPADAAVVQLEAKVTGQETHLAVSSTPADADATLRALENGADTLPLASQAQAGRSAHDEARTGQGSTGSERDGDASGASPGLSFSGVPAASERDSQGRFSDQQGLAGGQTGHQQERGTSSTVASTAAMFASALQAAGSGQTDDAAQPTLEPASDQIAAQVRAELKADGIGETSSDGVVKVLQIELKPANLGTVTVRLALKDNVISLHLEAERRETVAVIERQREALAGALASAGYDVDRITAAPQSEAGRLGAALSRVGEAGTAGSSGSFQGQTGGGQGLANSSGGGPGSGSGRPQGRPDYAPASGLNDDRAGLARPATDGLYV